MNGVYETDCAGFITHVLRQKAPIHLSLIPFQQGKIYHTVSDYYSYFKEIRDSLIKSDTAYWKVLTTLEEARRGDILVWVDDESDPDISLSHIFIFADSSKPIGDKIFETVVYDASEKPYNKDNRSINGLGYGMIRIKVDSLGMPVEYELRTGESFRKSNIIIARTL